MQFKGTKGKWIVGRIGGSVISEDVTQIDEDDKRSGHGDDKYYGGLLVCESIRTKADSLLVSKGPEMFALLLELLESGKLTTEWELKTHKLLKEATEL